MISWPESAMREVAILNEALENAEAEITRLREALRWCGDHGDNGCWAMAREVLGNNHA